MTGLVPGGEVEGHYDHAGQVEEAEAEAGEDAVGEHEAGHAAAAGGQAEAGGGHEAAQHAAGPRPPAGDQPRHQRTAEPIHADLRSKHHVTVHHH